MKMMKIDKYFYEEEDEEKQNKLDVCDTLLNMIDLLYLTVSFLSELNLTKYDQIDRNTNK